MSCQCVHELFYSLITLVKKVLFLYELLDSTLLEHSTFYTKRWMKQGFGCLNVLILLQTILLIVHSLNLERT